MSDKPDIVTKFLCPVCHANMLSIRRWVECPNGHGCMIMPSNILATRRHMGDMQRGVKSSLNVPPKGLRPVNTDAHGDINCAADGSTLNKTSYQSTSASIYVCPTCMYRWIDGKDLDAILGQYRNDGDDEPNSDDRIADFRQLGARGSADRWTTRTDSALRSL